MSGFTCGGSEAGFILGDQTKQRQCAYLDLIALG